MEPLLEKLFLLDVSLSGFSAFLAAAFAFSTCLFFLFCTGFFFTSATSAFIAVTSIRTKSNHQTGQQEGDFFHGKKGGLNIELRMYSDFA